jgi:hypothetical protein
MTAAPAARPTIAGVESPVFWVVVDVGEGDGEGDDLSGAEEGSEEGSTVTSEITVVIPPAAEVASWEVIVVVIVGDAVAILAVVTPAGQARVPRPF